MDRKSWSHEPRVERIALKGFLKEIQLTGNSLQRDDLPPKIKIAP